MSKNKDTVTLKEYFEHKLEDMEEKIDIKITSLKEATILARETMNERLAKMNEFRDTLKDQSTTFITKGEYNSFYEKTNISIKSLDESRAEAKGKASQSQVMIATLTGLIGIIVGIIGLSLRLLGM
jgi:hypothetical protein